MLLRLGVAVLLLATCGGGTSMETTRARPRERAQPQPPPPTQPTGSASVLPGPAPPLPPLPDGANAPPEILFDWPDSPKENRALALSEEDAFNIAHDCPESRVADARVPDGHRCRYPSTATLEIGGQTYWAAATQEASEHDGMYGVNQAIVLFAAQNKRLHAVTTFTQWAESVVDCRSTITMRRTHIVDLDRDGRTELCMETVEEEGVGLFYVLELQDKKQRWSPLARQRRIDAYRAEPLHLTRAPELSARCPAQGYAILIDLAPNDDPLAWRRSLQGKPALGRCPTGPVRACFSFDQLCPAHRSP